MKKIIAALLVTLLVLTGCSASSKTYKVGTAVITSLSTKDFTAATADSDAKSGQVQANTYYAIVLLDGDKVVKVSIDVAQNTVKFNGTGELEGFDANAATPTKKEKGADYGMAGSSALGKEWFEQMEALENYMVGKTIAEIEATATEEKDASHPAVPTGDLASSVSISIESYIAVVKKAAAAAVEVDGVVSVGAASNTAITGSNASADGDGKVQFDTTIAGTATDKDGKVIYTFIDAAQNSIKLDATSKVTVTSKDPVGFSSKKELKETYGMKDASKLGKEWYEQIAELEKAITGKSVSDIEAIAGDDGKATGDVATSVSITVTSYIKTVVKSTTADYTVAAE